MSEFYRDETEFEEIARIKDEPADEIVAKEDEDCFQYPLRNTHLFLTGYGEIKISTCGYRDENIKAATAVIAPWKTKSLIFNSDNMVDALLRHQNFVEQYLAHDAIIFEDRENKTAIRKENNERRL